MDAEADERMGELYDALLGLRMTGGQNGPEPAALRMSDAAKAALVDFFNAHGAEQEAMTDDRLRAAWAKLRGVDGRGRHGCRQDRRNIHARGHREEARLL